MALRRFVSATTILPHTSSSFAEQSSCPGNTTAEAFIDCCFPGLPKNLKRLVGILSPAADGAGDSLTSSALIS